MELLILGIGAVVVIAGAVGLISLSNSVSQVTDLSKATSDAIRGLVDNQKVQVSLAKAHGDAIADLQKAVSALKPSVPVKVEPKADTPKDAAKDVAKDTNGNSANTNGATKPAAKNEAANGKAPGNGK